MNANYYGDNKRPYVNSVVVRVLSKDIGKPMKNRKDIYSEQKFRLTNNITFKELKKATCNFYALRKIYNPNQIFLL